MARDRAVSGGRLFGAVLLMMSAGGVAIDQSGDIWVTNPSNNTLDEVIGGAAPVAPLATAVTNSTTGVTP